MQSRPVVGVSLALLVACLCRAAPGAELGEMRLYECTRTQTPPKLDGRLDDACWRTAEVSSGFTRTLRDTDQPPSVQTFVQLVYDDECVYVGIKCEEPHPDRMKIAIREHDSSSVCGDDSIEMFFHPDPQSANYYQLAANAAAVRYDGRGFDASWNADWRAAAHVAGDAWYLECAIALKSFPERRGIWRFNVCRELRSTDPIEFHCWSDTHGAFHTPSRFGHLTFSGPLAQLRRCALIQTARYAESTLRRQQALEQQTHEIARLRDAVPGSLIARFRKDIEGFSREEAGLIGKFSSKTRLSLPEWKQLDRGLADLLARRDALYWELKFHVLLND